MMSVGNDNGGQIAWTLERIEAARVVCSVLLVLALWELTFQSDQSDKWLYLALAVAGLAVALRPRRWSAIAMFVVAIIGRGTSVIWRAIETARIFGVDQARIEHRAVFAAGSLVFVVLMLNAIVGCWFLIRAGGLYSTFLREP